MLNWPGAKAGAGPPPAGCSDSVQVSSVSRPRETTRKGRGAIGPAAGAASARRQASHRRPVAGGGWPAGGRASPRRSAASARSRGSWSASHLPRRQAPSKATTRACSSARASKLQRCGGKSQDQPTTAPSPRVEIISGLLAGAVSSSATRPWRIAKKASAGSPSWARNSPASKTRLPPQPAISSSCAGVEPGERLGQTGRSRRGHPPLNPSRAIGSGSPPPPR